MSKKTPILQQHLRAEEERFLRRALEENGWVLLRAAKSLGMAFSSFQRSLGRHPTLQEEVKKKGRRPGRPPWKRDA